MKKNYTKLYKDYILEQGFCLLKIEITQFPGGLHLNANKVGIEKGCSFEKYTSKKNEIVYM